MKVNYNNKKKLQIMIFVLIAVITLGVGYAAISAINLVISGNATGTPSQSSFSVVFKSASVTTGTGTATIDPNDATVAYFDVSGLNAQGDTAVATYTIKNESYGVGAEIRLNIANTNSEYFQVTESITDNKLQAGDTTTATVTVQMKKTPINNNVTTTITGTINATPLENGSATGGSPTSVEAIPDPVSFATDSWATIKKAVQDNNTSLYNIGDTKEVTISGTDYTVRLANKTTGEHCGDNDTAYSQTACGFVVEFVDIITTMKMRDTKTNVGGYPATLVYDYLANTLYGELSQDLQSAIKPTRVISGYGCSEYGYDWDNNVCNNPDNSGNNFTTTDNLYLLSGIEIYGADIYDTAANATHQLDYYSNNEVTYDINSSTGTNIGIPIKQYQESNCGYWLRSASSFGNNAFRYIGNNGGVYSNTANYISGTRDGVAPAFRIG